MKQTLAFEKVTEICHISSMEKSTLKSPARIISSATLPNCSMDIINSFYEFITCSVRAVVTCHIAAYRKNTSCLN